MKMCMFLCFKHESTKIFMCKFSTAYSSADLGAPLRVFESFRSFFTRNHTEIILSQRHHHIDTLTLSHITPSQRHHHTHTLTSSSSLSTSHSRP